jgi:Thrombospondin type 3 repeat
MSSHLWCRGGIAVVALACASLLWAAPAAAEPCAVNLFDSDEFQWDLLSDGTIGNGSHPPSGRSDGYDNFGELYVSTDDGGNYSEYANPDDLACSYEDAGQEVAFPADTATVPGLEIRRKVFVPATGFPFARWIDSLTNTGGSPITLRMRWGGNLGSDSETHVLGSSSGELVFAAEDRWLATEDDEDPQLAHAWGTTLPGAADAADAAGQFDIANPPADPEEGHVVVEYRDLVVAPGETVSYMHAEAMRLTDVAALAAAQTLGSEPDELDAGISTEEGGRIRNWNVGDRERDGRPNAADNCAFAVNADQADLDGDGQGDACDDDIDGDGRSNALEGAFGTNPRAADTDGDGVRDVQDTCPTIAGRGADGCRRFDEQLTGDTTPLRVRLAGVRRSVTRRALLRRGLPVRARCNQACALKIELIGRRRTVRTARAGDLVLGARWLRRAEGTRRGRVKVARRNRGLVARGARVRLRVTAIDAAGHRRVARRVLRVR